MHVAMCTSSDSVHIATYIHLLVGITSKLDYFKKDLDVDTLWLYPLYPSDLVDAGFDVIDHKAIDKRYGTMEDFDELVEKMHKRGLCVSLGRCTVSPSPHILSSDSGTNKHKICTFPILVPN